MQRPRALHLGGRSGGPGRREHWRPPAQTATAGTIARKRGDVLETQRKVRPTRCGGTARRGEPMWVPQMPATAKKGDNEQERSDTTTGGAGGGPEARRREGAQRPDKKWRDGEAERHDAACPTRRAWRPEAPFRGDFNCCRGHLFSAGKFGFSACRGRSKIRMWICTVCEFAWRVLRHHSRVFG